jgi:heme-degrading monooxygenase HmoA
MLCALTIRRLKPGTFEEFQEAFQPPEEAVQQGWVRFHMLRSLNEENEAVSFGFFDGTIDELNSSQQQHNYDSMVERIAPYVESVVSNGVYEVVVSDTREAASA